LKILCRTLALLTFIYSSISPAQTVYVRNLTELSWQNRLVLLNGDNLPNEVLAHLTAESVELNSRQIVWFWRQNEKLKSNSFATLSAELKEQIASQLIQHNVVLIGKDGGIKFQGNEFELSSLLQLIDAMPMRQQEMKNQN
jgi:hypothetical protein